MRLCKNILFLLLIFTKIVNSAELTNDINKKLIKLSNQNNINLEELQDAVKKAKYNPKIIKKITTPWESKPWYKYYPIFLTPERLKAGLDFWCKHEEVLKKAENQLHVPASIIVAIIGIETYYGKHKGEYSVLNSLYTLGFHYPKRSKFFSTEFAKFIKLSQKQNWQYDKPLGSYAGAMGFGQFIPSSYLGYGIDFNNDGYIDMLNDPVDAIGSVANYFSKHKWQYQKHVAYKLDITDNQAKEFLTKNLKPKLKYVDIKNKLKLNLPILNNELVKIQEFEQETNFEYWLTLNNFFVITRYNHSPLYAMVAYQFSQQLQRARQEEL